MENHEYPAFPIPSGRPPSRSDYNGLTKREYFAAKAMQTILANAYLEAVDVSSSLKIDTNKVAKDAVRCADALIKALEESSNQTTQP